MLSVYPAAAAEFGNLVAYRVASEVHASADPSPRAAFPAVFAYLSFFDPSHPVPVGAGRLNAHPRRQPPLDVRLCWKYELATAV